MDVRSLISFFRLYPALKLTFKHNSVRKNLFLSACFCFESGFSFREMDQKFKFGGLIDMETLAWTLYFITRNYSDCMQ